MKPSQQEVRPEQPGQKRGDPDTCDLHPRRTVRASVAVAARARGRPGDGRSDLANRRAGRGAGDAVHRQRGLRELREPDGRGACAEDRVDVLEEGVADDPCGCARTGGVEREEAADAGVPSDLHEQEVRVRDRPRDGTRPVAHGDVHVRRAS